MAKIIAAKSVQVLTKRDFEELLLEAVDEGLSSLGESSKQAIYFHLEKDSGIKREEIPRKIQGFTDRIEQIFGLGASFLQILIMRHLYERADRNLTWDNSEELNLVEYVRMIKREYEKAPVHTSFE